MRRSALYVVAWLVAGTAAVSLAVAGVSAVGSQVTGDRPSPLSAAEVQAELTGDTTTTTPVAGAPGTGTVATTTGAPATTETGAPTTTKPGVAPATPTTTAPPATTAVPAAPAETRTYTMVGGTATLRFAASGVEIVVASPNAGYAVVVSETHGNGVRVEFRSDEHRSRVDAWWDGGPRDESEEQD